MNLLSAYTAFTRPASYPTGQTHSAERKQAEPAAKIAASADVDFIPASPSEETLANQAASKLPDLPKNVQSFLTTEDHNGLSRVGRFLDIRA